MSPPMIPVSGEYVVTFDGGEPIGEFRVEAWDPDGFPLIAGKAGLVKPSVVNAHWTCRPADIARPVGAIAADGWYVVFAYSDDRDEKWTEAIVGWAVLADGTIDPIVLDADEGPRLLSEELLTSSDDLTHSIKMVP